MKKRYIIFAVLTTIFLFAGCKQKSSEDKIFAKAQALYNKKGFDKFITYVSKNAYVPVADAAASQATPLLLAVKNGDLPSLQLFIGRGASVLEKDAEDRDGFDYAVQSRNTEIMSYVIDQLSQDYWSNKDAAGKLPCVKLICNFPDYKTVNRVIALTESPNAIDNNDKTLLMYAAQCNTDVRVTKFLLDNYADINKKNNNEWTAVMYAARYNPNPLVLEDLIVRGADLSANSVGLTLIMLASCNPNPGVLMTLFDHITDVNSQTIEGKTALMYACGNAQSSSVIKHLVDKGAEVDIRDKNGKTALMYALETYQKPEVVYLLITAGADSDISDNSGKHIKDYLAANEALLSSDVMKALEMKKAGGVPDTEQTDEQSSEAAEQSAASKEGSAA